MPDLPARKVMIFVSSPTDVMAERERAARVIDRLQSHFREHVTLQPVSSRRRRDIHRRQELPGANP